MQFIIACIFIISIKEKIQNIRQLKLALECSSFIHLYCGNYLLFMLVYNHVSRMDSANPLLPFVKN